MNGNGRGNNYNMLYDTYKRSLITCYFLHINETRSWYKW